MADHIDADEMKVTLQRVAAYRQVCEAVRATAGRTLSHGFVFLLLTAFIFWALNRLHPIVILYGAIAVLEILVGVWKKVRPVPECLLVDAILEAAFGLSVLGRHAAMAAANGFRVAQSTLIFGFIGLWSLYTAFGSMKEYFALRRMFVQRPTSSHLRYFDALVAEIRDADPRADSTALDLPTRPHLSAKLLGDVAFFVETRTGHVFVAGRDEVEIERREPKAGEGATAYLSVGETDFPGFPLDATTWQNFSAWKASR